MDLACAAPAPVLPKECVEVVEECPHGTSGERIGDEADDKPAFWTDRTRSRAVRALAGVRIQ
jgi:hypothetical protein